MPPSFWDFKKNTSRKKPEPRAKPEQTLSVSQLTSLIEGALKDCLPPSLAVKGEVSNFKHYTSSGHLYFTLKDAAACIDCVMFKSDAVRLKFDPGDGLDLIAMGRVGIYPQRGRYQLYVTALEPVGQGALELARQQIESKLRAQGLFEPDRKRPIPPYPRRIALVTSTQTAAVQDMFKVLRRFPFLKLMVFHVPVQGDGSAEKIADALSHLSRHHAKLGGVDLIILSRGGGSLEDLWEFNEEIVARAIAGCSIPVITGIGHEIDVSIADLVADHHAHTPTEAAQVAVRSWRIARDYLDTAGHRLARQSRAVLDTARQQLLSIERHEFFRRPLDCVNELRQILDDHQQSLALAITTRLSRVRDRLLRIEAHLRERHPRHRLALEQQALEGRRQRLVLALAGFMQQRRAQLDSLSAHLDGVNPEWVLKRGYSITLLKKGGQILRDPAQARPGDTIVTRLARGQIESIVEDSRQFKLFE